MQVFVLCRHRPHASALRLGYQGTMIQKSTMSDVSGLVSCLHCSFDDDPVVNWFLRQDSRREDAFQEFFRLAVVRQTLPFGEVYHARTNLDFAGVALWTPPHKWRLGWRDQLMLFPSILRLVPSLKALPRVLRGLHSMEAHHLEAPHVYLSFLCAHPTQRGQGLGQALLEPMLERCDQQGLPIYLENTKEQNEAFYRKYGFQVTQQIDLCRTNPPYYAAMVRPPRST